MRFLLDAHPDLACPPEIPDAAIRGVRRTLDEMTGSYLARRGKRRYCDKSLGTARLAGLLLRIYPEAKFLCLYRHPMDVIASGIEACPSRIAAGHQDRRKHARADCSVTILGPHSGQLAGSH